MKSIKRNLIDQELFIMANYDHNHPFLPYGYTERSQTASKGDRIKLNKKIVELEDRRHLTIKRFETLDTYFNDEKRAASDESKKSRLEKLTPPSDPLELTNIKIYNKTDARLEQLIRQVKIDLNITLTKEEALSLLIINASPVLGLGQFKHDPIVHGIFRKHASILAQRGMRSMRKHKKPDHKINVSIPKWLTYCLLRIGLEDGFKSYDQTINYLMEILQSPFYTEYIKALKDVLRTDLKDLTKPNNYNHNSSYLTDLINGRADPDMFIAYAAQEITVSRELSPNEKYEILAYIKKVADDRPLMDIIVKYKAISTAP